MVCCQCGVGLQVLCARANHTRIGEAAHPGRARAGARVERSAADLVAAPMLEAVTVKLQQRVWDNFELWLECRLSEDARSQVFLCPSLAAQVLRAYGCTCTREEALCMSCAIFL